MSTIETTVGSYKKAIDAMKKHGNALYRYALDSLTVCEVQATGDDMVACTDGNVVMLGNKFSDYKPEHAAYILAHEILHITQGHSRRSVKMSDSYGSEYNHNRFNLACDVVVNAIIDKYVPGFHNRPADRVTSDTISDRVSIYPRFGMTAEEIYASFKDDGEEDPKPPQEDLPEPTRYDGDEDEEDEQSDDNPEGGDDSGDGSDKSDDEGDETGGGDGEGDEMGNDGSESGEGEDDDGESGDQVTSDQGEGGDESENAESQPVVIKATGDSVNEDESEEESEETNEGDDNSGQGDSGAGVNGGLQHELDEERFYDGAKPVGEAMLKNYIGSRLRDERSYSRFNKRTRPLGLFMPADMGEDTPESVAIGFDMSSSQSPEALDRVIAIVNRLRKDHPTLDMEIFGWGNHVHPIEGAAWECTDGTDGRVTGDGWSVELPTEYWKFFCVEGVSGGGYEFLGRPRQAQKCICNARKAIRLIRAGNVHIDGGTSPLSGIKFASKYCKSKLLIMVTDGDFYELKNDNDRGLVRKEFDLEIVWAVVDCENGTDDNKWRRGMQLRNAKWTTVIL